MNINARTFPMLLEIPRHSNQVNPLPAKAYFSKFHRLEVVSRYRDPQLQVSENYS